MLTFAGLTDGQPKADTWELVVRQGGRSKAFDAACGWWYDTTRKLQNDHAGRPIAVFQEMIEESTTLVTAEQRTREWWILRRLVMSGRLATKFARSFPSRFLADEHGHALADLVGFRFRARIEEVRVSRDRPTRPR